MRVWEIERVIPKVIYKLGHAYQVGQMNCFLLFVWDFFRMTLLKIRIRTMHLKGFTLILHIVNIINTISNVVNVIAGVRNLIIIIRVIYDIVCTIWIIIHAINGFTLGDDELHKRIKLVKIILLLLHFNKLHERIHILFLLFYLFTLLLNILSYSLLVLKWNL